MKAYLEDNVFEASFENSDIPTENYFTLNGDGLISVCMRVYDSNKKKHHRICIYDHAADELKFLGNIPRHTFNGEFDNFFFADDDLKFVEGVIGELTHDSRFVIVLAYSRGLLTVNVFDICNTTCLLDFLWL